MYQYNSNGQKMPMQGMPMNKMQAMPREKMAVENYRENYMTKKSKMWLWIVIGIVVLLLIVGGVFLYNKYESKEKFTAPAGFKRSVMGMGKSQRFGYRFY